MHDALHQHAHVRILEPVDARATEVAVRKECEYIAGDLLDEGITVTAEEWHARVRRDRSCTGDDRALLRATSLVVHCGIAVRWVTAKILP